MQFTFKTVFGLFIYKSNTAGHIGRQNFPPEPGTFGTKKGVYLLLLQLKENNTTP